MLAIYTPYVLGSIATFEITPPPQEAFAARLKERGHLFPWLVCERAGQIVGYAYAGRLGERPAYDWACETSVYVADNTRANGVGSALYTKLLALLAEQGYCEAYARIATPNPQSERFHKKLGFRKEGELTRAGRKFGRVVGVAYYAKTLIEDDGNPPCITAVRGRAGR